MRTLELSPPVDLGKRRLKFMKAKEFDKKFEDGENILKYLDVRQAK
jgi:hypothetical protein